MCVRERERVTEVALLKHRLLLLHGLALRTKCFSLSLPLLLSVSQRQVVPIASLSRQ